MKRSGIVLALLVAVASGSAAAREIEGINFDETRNVGGHELKLVGLGLRTKWFFNVYVMAAYSKSGERTQRALLSNQPKFTWIKLLRKIPADKMRDALDEGFEKNVPEDKLGGLKERLEKLKGWFPDPIKKGLDIGFTYRPGTGTTVMIGGEEKGTLEGADFAKALWRVWFGNKPADKSLKNGILKD